MAASSSSSSTKPKRAHRTLTIETKVEILDQLGDKSYKLLSEKYGVGISTIADSR